MTHSKRMNDKYITGAFIGIGIFLLAVVSFAIFDHCYNLTLKTGVVVSKLHTPTYVFYSTISNGKETFMMPYIMPELWTVTIQGKDPKGISKSRCVYISVSDWTRITNGQILTFE